MFNENKNNKEELNLILDKDEDKDCKEDKIINHNTNDLCKKYINIIRRNMRALDKEMINNIKNMSNEEKMDIIISFNEVVMYLYDT
uniref:Uncharacterized protein n=1 Tax=viral metagenome TaxID=1070528 RepID=A0A6C0EUX1_9ZZZZ